MESFNEHLDTFLTGCRENALQELKSDGRYAEMKSNQNDLRSKIELLISPETQKLLETYFEITSGVQSMESNKILLCGFTL